MTDRILNRTGWMTSLMANSTQINDDKKSQVWIAKDSNHVFLKNSGYPRSPHGASLGVYSLHPNYSHRKWSRSSCSVIESLFLKKGKTRIKTNKTILKTRVPSSELYTPIKTTHKIPTILDFFRNAFHS